jgi:hypothetical protein
MKRAAALGCVMALTWAYGCGSPPLSVSQLRSSATRVCQTAARRGDQIPRPSSVDATGLFLRSGITILRQQLTGLRELHAPAKLARTYASAVNDVQQQVRYLEAARRQLSAGGAPIRTMRVLQSELTPTEAQADSDWRSLDIPACASQ